MAEDEPRSRFRTLPALKRNGANENRIEFLWKTRANKRAGKCITTNSGNKIKFGASSCKHAKQGAGHLNSSAAQSVKKIFFCSAISVTWCSFINETPYQMTTPGQNTLHTCCHIMFNHVAGGFSTRPPSQLDRSAKKKPAFDQDELLMLLSHSLSALNFFGNAS